MDTRFTVIGGGTGTYSVLSGLKKYTSNISAVVSMADTGGSAKKERDEWGLLPSSDIRKSLLALSNVSTHDQLLLRRLFQYRYSEGEGITGMSFGNLFLVALTKLLGSQEKAIEKAGKILRIKGRVLPVTLDKCNLVASYVDGSQVFGEHDIDNPKHNGKIPIVDVHLNPPAFISPDCRKAINESDVIILGPGGFYTTIVANLVVKGVKSAIEESKATKIFIMNLMTEYGQTYGFTAHRFIKELNKYIDINSLDYVFINNQPIPKKILKKYQAVKAEPIKNDISAKTSYQVISEDLLSPKIVRQEKGDLLQRSLIRHDPDKIAKLCHRILNLV